MWLHSGTGRFLKDYFGGRGEKIMSASQTSVITKHVFKYYHGIADFSIGWIIIMNQWTIQQERYHDDWKMKLTKYRAISMTKKWEITKKAVQWMQSKGNRPYKQLQWKDFLFLILFFPSGMKSDTSACKNENVGNLIASLIHAQLAV